MVKKLFFTGDEVDIHHALPVYLPSDGASSDDACWKSQHQVASPHQVGVAPGGEEQRAEGGSAVDGGQPPVPARLPAHQQQPLQGQKSPYFPPIVNQFPSRSIKPMRKFNSPPSFTLYNLRWCTNSDLVEIRKNFGSSAKLSTQWKPLI